MKIPRTVWLYGLGAILLYAFFQIMIMTGMLSTYYTVTLITIGINIILAVSLHLIIGVTGQFSIGHAGFLAIGAYVSAILTMNFSFPFPIAILVGGLAAALAGLLVGIPTLRLKGDYLAIATLGFGEIVRIILLNIEYVRGAAGMPVSHKTTWTYVFIFLVLAIVVIHNFTNSRHGRACISIREDEIAAESMGINSTYYKVIAFAIGSLFAGIAGALYAHNFYVIAPKDFGFLKSFEVLIFVVLGGLGSLSGSVIAAAFLTIVSNFFQGFADIRMILYSLVLILIMLYRPQGLMGNMEIGDLFKKGRRSKGGEGIGA